MPISAIGNDVWSPQVKFKLETSNYTETLLWVSGFSHALTEVAKEAKKLGMRGAYCLPSAGHIGSKELLDILNVGYAGQTISSETASSALLIGVRQRFPCK